MTTLTITNLHASVAGKPVLKGINLIVRSGEVHAVMGPNGGGKSTLSNVLMGHPAYTVDKGDVLVDGKSILKLAPEERAKLGLFLSFQYPLEIPGVTLSNFCRTAYNNLRDEKLSPLKFDALLKAKMSALHISPQFAERYLNEGFSGGEKKRCEMLQALLLSPKIAVLDETDSGLDVDALKIVAQGANALVKQGAGLLVITHYQRILRYVKPGHVHVLVAGRIVESGGPELAEKLESHGYAKYEGLKVV